MKLFVKILVTVSWALFIFVLVDRPWREMEASSVPFLDKGTHFFIFGVLAYLIIIVFKENKKLKFIFISFLSFLLSLAYSAFTEYFQRFVPGRDPSLFDFLASIAGIIFAIFIFRFYGNKKPKILLHICCIGCGVYIAETLKKDYDLILYFFNPNIFPKEEYEKRLEEIKKIAKKFNLKVIVGENNHDEWLKTIRGMEGDPEGGRRCRICYKYRLEQAARLAKKEKCEFFATTLAISPHKDSKVINEAGKEVAKKYGVKFLEKDFKEDNGFKKSCEMSKKLELYRQNYCGCEFSVRK